MTSPATRFSGYQNWTMQDERIFLSGLGTWRPQPNPVEIRPSRAELLEGYLSGLDKRSAWGELDPEVLRRLAESELAKEMTLPDDQQS